MSWDAEGMALAHLCGCWTLPWSPRSQPMGNRVLQLPLGHQSKQGRLRMCPTSCPLLWGRRQPSATEVQDSPLSSLYFSFLICKMGIIVMPAPWGERQSLIGG